MMTSSALKNDPSLYRNTFRCDCGAIVGNDSKWVFGQWRGTTGGFEIHGKIPDDECPMCLRKRPGAR